MNSVGPCWHIIGVYSKLGRVRVFYHLWFYWDLVCVACCRRSGTNQPSETLSLKVPGVPFSFGSDSLCCGLETSFDFVSEL